MESMKKSDRTGSKLPAAGSLAAAVLLWLLASEARLVPSFLLPSPAAVCRALAEDAPVLLENAGVTLLEAALGLAAGILSALVLATLMHHVPVLYRALYPILVITQTIPTVALAALLDEPFSALDALTKREIHQWYLGMMDQLRIAALFITHDIDEAILLSDRVCVLSGRPGRVAAELTIRPPRPRDPSFPVSGEFLDYKKRILSLLEA